MSVETEHSNGTSVGIHGLIFGVQDLNARTLFGVLYSVSMHTECLPALSNTSSIETVKSESSKRVYAAYLGAHLH